MRTATRRRWPIVTAVAVVLALGGGALYWFVWRTPPAAAATTITQTGTASLETLDSSISGSGTITAAVNESVSFAAAGTVLTVDVAEGDTVAAGQTLATIDTLHLTASLADANADLAKAQASLASAEDADDGTSSAQAQVTAAQAQLALAQEAADEASANMADANLIAPVAGQVTSVGVAVGDTVGSSGSGSTGPEQSIGTGSTAAFTIVGTDSWSVDLSVSDADLAKLSLGDQAEVTVDSNLVFGTITALGKVADTSSGSAKFPVTVTITGTPEGLFDGLSATVDLIYERRIDVLTVPLAAVRTQDGTSYVDKLVDGEPVETVVTTGETSGDLIEITDGLAEGDDVQITVVLQDTTGNSDNGTVTGPAGFSGDFPGGGMPTGFPGGPQFQQGGDSGSRP